MNPYITYRDMHFRKAISADEMTLDVSDFRQSCPHHSFDSNLLPSRSTLLPKIKHVWFVRLCRKDTKLVRHCYSGSIIVASPRKYISWASSARLLRAVSRGKRTAVNLKAFRLTSGWSTARHRWRWTSLSALHLMQRQLKLNCIQCVFVSIHPSVRLYVCRIVWRWREVHGHAVQIAYRLVNQMSGSCILPGASCGHVSHPLATSSYLQNTGQLKSYGLPSPSSTCNP